MKDSAFVIVVPNAMAFRALAESNVLPILEQQGKKNIFVLSADREDASRLPETIKWRSVFCPSTSSPGQGFGRRLVRSISIRIGQWLGLAYGNIAYRFNHLLGFKAHQFKQRMSEERQEREALAGNYVNPRFGRPFPGSKLLYRMIYAFYYAGWQVPDRGIEQFFYEEQIETIVLWYVQNQLYRDYSICIRARKMRAVGVIGSWDRLTTKGPICPGCQCFVVNNQVMKQELIQFHNVEAGDISVVGWPQMDIYQEKSQFWDRVAFFERYHIDPNHQIIVFAGNSERLGQHEPGIANFLAKQIKLGVYGENVSLLIRTHPNDNDWETRYQSLIDAPNVTIMSAGMDNLELLTNTLLHADIVVLTQGSISLDAAAFDKCIVNIAFDGENQKESHESVLRLYEMDHYRPVVESGGVRLARSYDELNHWVGMYLSDTSLDVAGREKLREQYLTPFDGRASKRQVLAMMGEPV